MHFILILKHAGSNVIALFKKTLCDRKTASCKQNAHIMYYIQKLTVRAGLSLRARGRGFSPATKRVAPGYFYRKIEEK